MQKCIFNKVAKFIEILIIITFFFAVLLRRYYSNHSVICSKFDDFIGIISTVRQQAVCFYSVDKLHSFFAISSGTFCNKDSDRHTIRIHGKVNFSIEPPFVRLMP